MNVRSEIWILVSQGSVKTPTFFSLHDRLKNNQKCQKNPQFLELVSIFANDLWSHCSTVYFWNSLDSDKLEFFELIYGKVLRLVVTWSLLKVLKLFALKVNFSAFSVNPDFKRAKWAKCLTKRNPDLPSNPESPLLSSHTRIIYDVIQTVTHFLIRSLYTAKKS